MKDGSASFRLVLVLNERRVEWLRKKNPGVTIAMTLTTSVHIESSCDHGKTISHDLDSCQQLRLNSDEAFAFGEG